MSKTILWPFYIDATGAVGNTESDSEAIDSLLKFILSINENEVLGDPNIGCKLNNLVFETRKEILDTMSQFYIEEIVKKYFLNIIKLKSIDGEKVGKVYTIYITYEIISTGEIATTSYELNLRV